MNNVIENYRDFRQFNEIVTKNTLNSMFPKESKSNINHLVYELKNILTDEYGEYPVEHHYLFWDAIYTAIKKIPPTDEELGILYKIYLNNYLKNINVYPDARRSIKLLKDKGLRLGIIANGNSLRIRAFLQKHDLFHFFDSVTASHDFNYKKPEVKIFEYALLRNKEKPLSSVMVGDRIDNDVKGANRTGLWSIHLKRFNGSEKENTSSFSHPDDTIDSLDNLAESWILKNELKINSAVIFAAGIGSRMSKLTKMRQKCTLPVGGKPIIQHILENLNRAGINKIVVLVKHRKEDVIDLITELGYSDICQILEAKRSTAESLLVALKYLDDNFLFSHGDILYSRAELHTLIKNYIKMKNISNIASLVGTVPITVNLTHAIVRTVNNNKLEIFKSNHYSRADIDFQTNIPEFSYSFGLGIIDKNQIDTDTTQSDDKFMLEELIKNPSMEGLVRQYALQDKWYHLETEQDYLAIKDSVEIL